ncbi:HlyD family secretion protein [Desulfitobacterium sp.]|uniref:HlyD family secretion protein n=1 Tax=Desulfitobacterium sp. TaxID=49981 RepID=UPI002C4D6E51|nr:efflux RND transporter periplasmic adaptor subunit [Desulfitobacterium sp.]HVJ49282.1 efflux RND transporter periplasmic adaptor subunit [Desulfitobacterium sp.]
MKRNENLIFTIIGLLILVGVGIWTYFYVQSNTYFTTDNAKVTTEVYNVAPSASGRLVKLNVAEGSLVKENEVLGRLENGSYLRSPIKGQVVKSNVVLNQLVSPTVVAAVVADIDHSYVSANIEETNITKIKEGQDVTVQLDAYPGQKFKGQVKEINKVTQTALSGNATSFSTSGTYTKVTQLIPVKIVLEDTGKLEGLIGTNATVKIKIK